MSAPVTIRIDGETVTAEPGVTLASIIHAASRPFRKSPRLAAPRGLYCGMGVCFECLVRVDGQPVRACITPIEAGMTVELDA